MSARWSHLAEPRSERERGLLVNLRQVWAWYRQTHRVHGLKGLRREAVREIVYEIRKARRAA